MTIDAEPIPWQVVPFKIFVLTYLTLMARSIYIMGRVSAILTPGFCAQSPLIFHVLQQHPAENIKQLLSMPRMQRSSIETASEDSALLVTIKYNMVSMII